MNIECENLCPNCGVEIETANGHIYTNSGDTYFKVDIEYCPECKYIGYTDAIL